MVAFALIWKELLTSKVAAGRISPPPPPPGLNRVKVQEDNVKKIMLPNDITTKDGCETHLWRHDKKRNKQIPNCHVYNQKVEGAFHPFASSHNVDDACVTKETHDEDDDIS